MNTVRQEPVRRRDLWAFRLLLALALLGGWEYLAIQEGGLFLPRFTSTFVELIRVLGTAELWRAVWVSNVSVLIGLPVSLIVGIGLGFLLGRVRRIDHFFGYYLDLLMVVPMIAVVPIIIVALGLGLQSRVAVVVLFTLPVVGMNARAAVRVIDAARIEMARAFTATRLQVWTKVILPEAAGPVFTGIRLGLSRAISGMVVVELTLIPAGLGGLIVDQRARFNAIGLFATTLVIVGEGILLVALLRRAERWTHRRLTGVAA